MPERTPCVSSTYGRSGAPGAALYVRSKHAVEDFTKAAALEFAETGIRINVVAPGLIETGMLKRFTGTPENKADLISRVPMKRIGQPALPTGESLRDEATRGS